MPSPDSDPLSALSEPTLMFGIAALSFGNSAANAGEKPSVRQVEALADAPLREFLRGEAVAELQHQGGAEHVHFVQRDGAVDPVQDRCRSRSCWSDRRGSCGSCLPARNRGGRG